MQSKVIQFKVVEPPKVKEVQGKKWVYYGSSNDYPSTLRDLAQTSSLHSTILKSKIDSIVGGGLMCPTNPELLTFANEDGESWDDIFRKVANDFTLYGGFSLNIVHSNDRSRVSVYHIDYGNVRVCSTKDDLDRITGYYYSNKWHNTTKYPPKYYEAFSMVSEDDSTILTYQPYFPGQEFYPVPDYSGGLASINLSREVERFHQYNLENGMVPSLWVNFPSQPQDEDAVRDIYRQIEDNYGGVDNAGKFILTFSDGSELQPTITPISVNQNDKYYSTINEMTEQSILAAHRVITPALVGIKEDGFNIGKEEILERYALWMKNVIEPYQKQILTIFDRLLTINNGNEPVMLSVKENEIFDKDGELDI